MGGNKERDLGTPSVYPGSQRLQLRIRPDPVLRVKAEPVMEFDKELHELMEEMLKFMRLHNGIGLAAPQVGISRRIIVADIGTGPLSLANPEILDATGKDKMVEGCLSLPGVEVNVRRKKRIEVTGVSSRGKEVHTTVSDLMARVIQHEIDHLNGILICDYDLGHRESGNS